MKLFVANGLEGQTLNDSNIFPKNLSTIVHDPALDQLMPVTNEGRVGLGVFDSHIVLTFSYYINLG